MIKKAQSIPPDVTELLVSSKKEIVPIGDNAYEVYPLPVEGYFKFLGFLAKYAKAYEKYVQDATSISSGELLGYIFSDEEFKKEMYSFLLDLFPEIEDDIKKMTGVQFRYLMGVMYKQNFLSQLPPEKAEVIREIDRVLGIRLQT